MAQKKEGVHFDITAQNATDRAFRAVESNLQAINKAGDAVGRTLQSAFAATAVISAGMAFATAAIEAEQASKRLDAVLKATGNSAGRTKQQLDDMADSMAESTQFDDEGLRNAQAQMLKFGNIHGETFDKALKLSADLAAFMGTDLNSAVQAVGKALTSPTEGMTALERQVGKFNPAAKEMIKNLVETGNEGKAQAAVLDLLQAKVGGTAEALNSGLSKAAGEAKKQWNEMLEAIGKTEVFQRVAKSGLGFIEQSFRDIKNIVENGDWVEKTLAILAFAGGWRGMKLTPAAPDAVNNVKGRIRGVPSATVMDDDLTGSPMSERDIKAWKDMLQLTEELNRKRKQEAEERTRDNEKLARIELEAEEQLQKELTEAQEHWQKLRQENDKREADAKAEMWKQVFETIDREQEEAIENGRILLEGIEAQAKKDADAAKEFGMIFVSAFEDAVVSGKKLKDVLGSLLQDLAKMFLRKGVTGPLGNFVSSLFPSGIGSIGDNFFADGGIMTSAGPMPLRRYSSGGVASSPQLAMFGEGSQNEAFVPLPDGRRIPVEMRGGGGGISITNIIHVESTGDAQKDGEVIAGKVTEAMRNIARQTARTVIGEEMRPGGVLA